MFHDNTGGQAGRGSGSGGVRGQAGGEVGGGVFHNIPEHSYLLDVVCSLD